MTAKELKALQDDARRYRALRTNAYHFSVTIRYPYGSKEERDNGSWVYTNHVVGSLMDDLIDAWMEHPSYNTPKR